VLPIARRLVPFLLLVTSAPAGAAPELVYVAMGERSGGGDPARIAEQLGRAGARVRLVDLTAAGATSETVWRDQVPRAVALRSALVTLSVGASDVCGQTALGRFSRDLQMIADLLRRNSARVLVSTIAPPAGDCGRTPARLRARLEAFNWAIVRAAQHNGLGLVELRTGGEGGASSWEVVVGEGAARW